MHKTVVGVLAVITDQKGKYLLALRNDPVKKPHLHHKWELTGGKLEYGENPEICLNREVDEELGVVPTILYPHPIVVTRTSKTRKGVSIVLIGFLSSIGAQIPQPNHKEVIRTQWFYPEEIRQLDTLPKVDDFIEQAQKMRMHIHQNNW